MLLGASIIVAQVLRRSRGKPKAVDNDVAVEKQLPHAKLDEGEEVAEPISEEIEELARRKLASEYGMSDVELDFGTGGDGSLEIWVGGDCYDSYDKIPDSRIRDSIKAAVEEYNLRKL
jgi:hypothetical protein